MAAETPGAASFKKRLPWLKRLQGDLDDDDSSDSSLPMTEPTPKLAVRPTKQKTTTKKKTMLDTEGKSYKRVKTKRQVPTREDSDGASSNDSDADRHMKKRLLKKRNDETSSFMRRKRRTEAVKEVSPRNKLKKLSIKHDRSRAVEEQRTQKLHDRRSSAGKSDDVAISKSRREKPYEVRRKKEKTCDVADRLFQEKAQGLICSEADVKGKRDYRIRSSPQPMTDGISFVDERAEKCKLLKNAGAKMAEKTCKGATSPDVAVSDDASDLVKCGGRDTVTTDLGSTVDFTSVPVNNDGAQDSVLKSINPDQMDEDNGCFPAAVGEKIDGCVQPERLGNSCSVSRESKKLDARIPAEKAGTIATPNTSGEADAGTKSVVAESVPHDPSRPHSKDKMDKQPEPAALAAPERGSNEANNKQNLESSVITPSAESLPNYEDGSGKLGDEKSCRTMALQTKPTVCEETKKERISAVPYAGSFIIPKRSSGNSCSADETVILPVNRARDIRARGMTDTRSVIPSKHTAVPSLSCVDRCSKFSAVDVVHPSAKRSKNPVPIGAASSCSQDRALLRLSRSRNSIYMAVGELALGATDLRSSKELQTRMMGYEVYDVDGKVLPDLISRYSCATSGEMASSRKLYTASFFGVSLAPPIAADETSAAAVKCGSGESGTRNISCYEELRFGRPEDREFYQQKMYGTAFVPQNLRGQITLVVRNARFERKSTGIRFNQDRDREDFAVSLSKRYTLGKSVPRCEISRDNWLKMMKNQLGSVYLHYYNREDGERASQIFHDDIGHLLELRLKLKAGAVLEKESSCQAARPKLHVSPCRSLSSERSKPESSPLLSQNGGAITPPRQRERRIASKGDDRLSKIDRNAPPPIGPWCGKERQYDLIDGGRNRSRATTGYRSRSRSKSKSYYRQDDALAPDQKVGRGNTGGFKVPHLAPDIRERSGSGNVIITSAICNDADTPVLKRARISRYSPRLSSSYGADRREGEKRRDTGHKGEANRCTAETHFTRNAGGDDSRCRRYRAPSPLRRRQPDPSNTESSERRNEHSNYSQNRSRGSPIEHRFDQQRTDSFMGTRRSRSRSRSRPRTLLAHRVPDYDTHSDRYMERRDNRKYEPGGVFDNNTYDRRSHVDTRHGGYDAYGGGRRSRPR